MSQPCVSLSGSYLDTLWWQPRQCSPALWCFPLTPLSHISGSQMAVHVNENRSHSQAVGWGNELWVNNVFTGFLAHKTPAITYIITSCTCLNLSVWYKLKNTDISKPFISYQIVLDLLGPYKYILNSELLVNNNLSHFHIFPGTLL